MGAKRVSIARLVQQLVPSKPPAASQDSEAPRPSLTVLVRRLCDSLPPGEKPFGLGVLFVHGVGEQQQGDTLTEMGDALIQWMKRWVERPPPGQVTGSEGEIRILSASLREPGDDLVSFSNLALEIAVPQGDGRQTTNWLVGESWWADVFRPPSFAEFAAWGMSVGQWEAVTQILDIFERLRLPSHAPGALRAALWPIAVMLMAILVLASIAASSLMILLAAALTILRLIPIGPVQQAALAGQRTMAMGAGDAFILVRSPARFAAMVSRVRDDLAEMREYCDEVIVVAHSQGAQVAWEAIRRSDPGPEAIPKGLSRFVTFGQALRRLKLLYRVTHLELDGTVLRSIVGGIAAQLGLVLLLGSVADVLLNGGRALHAVLSWLPGDPGDAFGPFFAVLLAAVVAGETVVLAAARRYDTCSAKALTTEIEAATKDNATFEWIDLWASADPISNGSLLPSPPARVTTWRIHNLGSPILDHVVYWNNLTEFVAAVATDLGNRAFPESPYFPAAYPHPRLIAASQQHGARVTTLTLLRIGWVGTVLAWTPALMTVAAPPLRVVTEAVRTWPIIGGPVEFLGPVLPVALGLAVVGLVALLLWRVHSIVWRFGVLADERAYFRPRVEGGMPSVEDLFPWVSRVAFGLFAVPLVTPVLLAIAGWPVLAKLHLALVPLAMLAVPVFISGGRRMGDDPETSEPILRREDRRWLFLMFGVALVLTLGIGIAAAQDVLVPQALEAAAWVIVAAAVLLLALAAGIEFWHFRERYESYRARILYEQESPSASEE